MKYLGPLMYSFSPMTLCSHKSVVGLDQCLERLSLGFFQSFVEESSVGFAHMEYCHGTKLEFLPQNL